MRNLFLLIMMFALVACSKPVEEPAKKDEAPKVEKKADEKKAEPAKEAPKAETEKKAPEKKEEAKKVPDPEKVKKADPKLVEALKAEVKLDASNSTCDTCVTVGTWIIGKVGCTGGEVALDAACTAAEVVFFEFDEIIGPLCTAAEIALPVICAEMGKAFDAKKAAQEICQKAGFCS